MKKLIALSMFALVFSSCDTDDKCHCEVFENIGTEEEPIYRYIGSMDGKCDDHVLEEDLLYDTVSCS